MGLKTLSKTSTAARFVVFRDGSMFLAHFRELKTAESGQQVLGKIITK